MAMMRLALQEGMSPLPLVALAREQGVSVSSLEKIAALLRRAGLLRAVRGPGGGYILARPASQINLADIITAVEWSAPGQRPGSGSTHAVWDNLGVTFYAFLGEITLADTLGGTKRPVY